MRARALPRACPNSFGLLYERERSENPTSKLDFAVLTKGILVQQWPRAYHYLILATLVVAVFLIDLWVPLGIAVWLLYVIPLGYTLRFVRQGRITFSTLSLATGGLTVLLLLA